MSNLLQLSFIYTFHVNIENNDNSNPLKRMRFWPVSVTIVHFSSLILAKEGFSEKEAVFQTILFKIIFRGVQMCSRNLDV